MQRTLIIVVLSILAVAGLVLAQNEMTPEEMAAKAAEYQKLAQPSEAHERLVNLEGEWKQVGRFWAQPGAEDAMGFEGTCTNKMILGGRFLECRSKSGEGMWSSESLTLMGFDNRTQQYTTVGFDTWGTYFITAYGTYDEATGSITFSGSDYDPAAGFTQEFDIVTEIDGADRFVTTLIFRDSVMTAGTGEFKMAEVEYTRVK